MQGEGGRRGVGVESNGCVDAVRVHVLMGTVRASIRFTVSSHSRRKERGGRGRDTAPS